MDKPRSRRGRRTVTWVHSGMDANMIFAMRGLDLLNAVKEGRIPVPPVWNLVDFRLAEIAEGHVVFEIDPAEYHLNRFGIVQGGLECAVLDAAAGYAVHSTLPAGTGYTTLELKVNFFRPISMETGLIRCVGSIIHRGTRVAVADANMLDNNNLPYAHAISTCLLFKIKEVTGKAGKTSE
jgi:uncharacterized protein (TIGR00369 family)